METPFEAFILLVNEQTQNYEPMPCTVTVCEHHKRTVVLKDKTIIENAEPMRIFTEAIVAIHFERELNDIKRRSLAAGEWATLEIEMKKEQVHA